MNNEFKTIKTDKETIFVLETTSGGTTSAASVGSGSVVKALGQPHKRKTDEEAGKVPQKPRQGPLRPQTGGGTHRDKKREQKQGQQKHRKPFMEYDLEEIHEPGHEPDHEISMANSQLLSIIEDAMRLIKIIKHYSEMEGLEAWQQSKLTKAADYLNAVLNNLQGKEVFQKEDHNDYGKGWGQESYNTYAGTRHGRGVAEGYFDDDGFIDKIVTKIEKEIYDKKLKGEDALYYLRVQVLDQALKWVGRHLRKNYEPYLEYVENWEDAKEFLTVAYRDAQNKGMAEGKIKGVDGKACWKGKRRLVS